LIFCKKACETDEEPCIVAASPPPDGGGGAEALFPLSPRHAILFASPMISHTGRTRGTAIMRTILAGALAATLLGGPSVAAEQSMDVTPDFIANLARGYGSAVLNTMKDGKPIVLGRIQGQNYVIFLIDCENRPSCALIQFSAQFPGEKTDPVKINAWNRDKRFGRVAVSTDQKIWASQAIITGEGLPLKSLERYFGFWQIVLKELPPFIAAK
jgi:hypothetical protein